MELEEALWQLNACCRMKTEDRISKGEEKLGVRKK